MRKIFVFLSFMVLCLLLQFTVAATANKKVENFTLDFVYDYSALNSISKISQNSISSKVRLFTDNWTVFGGSQTAKQQQPSNVFVLLGKVEKLDTNEAKINFLTIFINSNNQVALEKSMIVSLGKRERIKLNNGKNNIQIDFVVNAS